MSDMSNIVDHPKSIYLLPIMIGLGIVFGTVIVYLQIYDYQQKLSESFKHEINGILEGIIDRKESRLQTVSNSIIGLFESSTEVTQKEFAIFSDRIFRSNPELVNVSILDKDQMIIYSFPQPDMVEENFDTLFPSHPTTINGIKAMNLEFPMDDLHRLIISVPFDYFISYENLRIGMNSIEYLATGNKRFLMPLQTKDVPSLLEGLYPVKPKCSFDFGDIQAVSSDQYFTIHQLVKNAVKFVYQAKEESKTPDIIDDSIVIRVNETDIHLVATVKDNGTGIINDKMGLIFGGYTDGGTNVGLRIVKRILDLSGGYAEVISTRAGKETFKYNTKTNTTLKIGDNQPHGTTFALYFPKAP